MVFNTSPMTATDPRPQGENTFFLDRQTNSLRGMCSGQEAVRQAAWFILHTTRFDYPIYSFDYGNELETLGGTPDSFLFPELKRRVREALFVDERIVAVDSFSFSRVGTRVGVSFVIHTVYGDLAMDLEV